MNTLLFLGNFGHWEIIIIVALVLLFFGGKKIPELMKGLGKGINQFKQGLKEVEDDIKSEPTDNNKPANN
jgi:sec-independent protein translocase protein TatA